MNAEKERKYEERQKAYRARQLRYKKPIARFLNFDKIRNELYDMMEICEGIHWYDNDEESLVNALDGDDDEAFEFKVAFSDLEAELEEFQRDIEEAYVPEYYDLLFPAVKARYAGGYLGYDEYEGDYMGIEPYEYDYAEDEAAKKFMQLTKKQMLEAVGACLKIAYQYIAVRYRYDCMEAAIEILRGENREKLQAVKAIEEQYIIADKATNGFTWSSPEETKLDKLLDLVPQEYWIQ